MSKKKKSVKGNKVAGAVFVYTSVCCGKPAKKPALVWTPEDRAARKYSEGSLGHWRCSNCERPCKVTRSRKEVVQDTETNDGTN
jgi:hypothetical protein